MRENTVRRQLREGKPSVGTWLTLPDPIAAMHMARVGFDWLNVEMEHSTIGLETAGLMFHAIAQAGCVPLVRVGANTLDNVKRVLDAGAWGVIFPMQNTPEEVRMAVSYCRYPPVGTRSVGGGLHTLSFDTDGATYFNRANDEILVIVQIEHIDAVERADELLSIPGVDAVFIGPSDLSASMGVQPGLDSDHPGVQDAIRRVREAAERHGVAPGIHTSGPEAAKRRIAEGFRFVAIASEMRFMTAGAEETLRSLRADG